MSINRISLALNASENERFLVRKGVDMLALLRALAARRNPAVLHFGAADDHVDAEFLGLNPAYEELVFSPGSDPDAFARLLAAGSFGVETSLDSIRIVFIASHAEITQFAAQTALRARIPDVLARMQRRESVRIPLPEDKPSFCTIRVAANPARELRLRVVNVSIGGLGLALDAAETALAPGKTFHECGLELPGMGVMRCTLNIVHANPIPPGGTGQRVGARFVDLAGLSREQLRGFVARLERAQLAGS